MPPVIGNSFQYLTPTNDNMIHVYIYPDRKPNIILRPIIYKGPAADLMVRDNLTASSALPTIVCGPALRRRTPSRRVQRNDRRLAAAIGPLLAFDSLSAVHR